jgi:valyl-tRNA synthetase
MANHKKVKYNLKEIEERWKKYWEEKQIYKFNPNSGKPLYSVDTPPPYVSADHLHAGHIMSYAQAEFIVRFKRMRGFNVYYPMGFDDNGLPTERFVENKYKIDKSKITKSEFIKLCLEETEFGSRTYKNLWNNLGISVDWSKTYSTIGPLATKISQWSLIELYQKGALYRSDEPILWCTFCQTALAQADLEDREVESKMYFISFKGSNGKNLTIGTTRPELIPACVALYVNPEDARYKDLIGQKASVPLFDHEVTIGSSDRVDPKLGTGLMMVCTWGDQEDLEKWRSNRLPTRALFTQDGKLNELGGSYRGLGIQEARTEITESLKKEGFLIKQENLTHTLNVHERCGTAVEFIPSKQWFIRIVDLKEEWLKYGRELNWYPKSRRKDYELWVETLKWDWCISRQRYYGVPLPIWYCSECDEPIFARKEDLPIDPTENEPSTKKCPKCGNRVMIPERDVMDTWATSSLTPLIIKELVAEEKITGQLFPATLRPNAFEIIRTWDFYTIVKSHYHFGKLPFEDVMISGHGLDEEGRKLAKRLGNYLPSDQLLDQFGADPIRYWATGAKLGHNLRFSPQEIEKGKKTTIKLWNAARFIKRGLEHTSLATTEPTLEYADIWIISEFNQTLKEVTKAFENYTYSIARDALDDFFWSKFADYYIEFVKYRLNDENKPSQEAALRTLFRVFLGILKMYAPILPFITEELYQDIYKSLDKEESIHLSNWPAEIEYRSQLDISDFKQAIKAIDEIRAYKSRNGIPLGNQLSEYHLEAKLDIGKYGDFVKKAIKIDQLS